MTIPQLIIAFLIVCFITAISVITGIYYIVYFFNIQKLTNDFRKIEKALIKVAIFAIIIPSVGIFLAVKLSNLIINPSLELTRTESFQTQLMNYPIPFFSSPTFNGWFVFLSLWLLYYYVYQRKKKNLVLFENPKMKVSILFSLLVLIITFSTQSIIFGFFLLVDIYATYFIIRDADVIGYLKKVNQN